jgi:hypothetical protein|tara:strand:- start:1806 stop:2189 length:384 start_codon:yes stop_codon:yes gene_type:complete
MDRRTELLSKVIKNHDSEDEAKYLDVTVKIILADMGKHWVKCWTEQGPGVLVFQPGAEHSAFWMTLEELESAKRNSEDDDSLYQVYDRIIQAAAKIKPEEKAGYLLNDERGMRYIEIDYNKMADGAS